MDRADGPDGARGAEPVSFLGAPSPEGFRLRLAILEPGDSLCYRHGDWLATLVVVEQGELDVECASGTHARFGEGAVLTFAGVPVSRLHSVGDAPLVLSALSRALY
ncbi:MAG: hypothetical protein ACJ786_41120 [Catenulispora sp.]